MKGSFNSIFFSLLIAFNLTAQEFTIISKQDFENINFNSRITLKELIAVKDYEAKLESLFGPPLSKQIQTTVMSLKNGDIYYNGFQLGFLLDDEINDLVLTNSSKSLNYNGHQLRVGMSLNEIEKLFKKSYDSRYVVDLNGGEHIIKVETNPYSLRPTILFIYDPTHRVVTEIAVHFETSR